MSLRAPSPPGKSGRADDRHSTDRTPRTSETFVAHLARGLWPLAIHPNLKRPIGDGWGSERWTLDKGAQAYRDHPKAGVGVCLGPGRAPDGGCLGDVEGDGPGAADSLARLFGGEDLETMGWDSARGPHRLIRFDGDRLAAITLRLKAYQVKDSAQPGVFHVPALPGVELRLGGFKADGTVKQLQSVTWPTVGTDGKPRVWNGVETIADAPESFYEVLETIADAVEAAAKPTPQPPASAALAPRPKGVKADRVGTYLTRALEKSAGQVEGAAEGTRHNTLLAQARALAGYLHYERGYTEAELAQVMTEAGGRAGQGDADATVRDAIQDGKANPLTLPEELHLIATGSGGNGHRNGAGATARNGHQGSVTPVVEPEPETDEELGLTDLSTVECKELEWAWDDRFPLGKISLLAGEGGIGKSFMTLYMAMVISRGGVWPDIPTTPVPQGDVILLSAEDDLADTVVPRLKAMGANLKRIVALGTAKGKNGLLTPFTLQDIDRLERVMARRPATRMIVIDPITAYLGAVNDHKNAELRGLLGPLSEFAAKHRVAIIAVTHFNKSVGGKASAKIIGSVAYSNAARATWCVALDPENETRRLLMPVKANLSKTQSSLAYTIADGIVVWEAGSFKANVNEVLGGDSSPKDSRRRKAVAWLQETLVMGGMPSEDVIEAAKGAGFGKNLIWEVREEAGVRAKKDGFNGGWVWVIDAPPPTPEPAPPTTIRMVGETSGDLGFLGTVGETSKAPQVYRSIPKDADGAQGSRSTPKTAMEVLDL